MPHISSTATEAELDRTEALVRRIHRVEPWEKISFFAVEPVDASRFDQELQVEGRRVGCHNVLCAKGSAIPSSIAALLLALEDKTGRVPHVYFEWKEGNPLANMARFIFLGEGDEAPLTHEILRREVRDAERRPIVHVS